MSYSGLGDLVTDMSATLKNEARQTAIGKGVPAPLFDSYDSLATGIVTGDIAGARQKAAALIGQVGSQALQSVLGQEGGGSAGNILQAIVSGGSVNPEDVGAVVGAGVGMVVCAGNPICGAVGGMVGKLVVTAVESIIAGIGDLFGANNAKRVDAERQLRSEIDAIRAGLVRRANEYIVNYQFGIARVYNHMVLEPLGAAVSADDLLPNSTLNGQIPLVFRALDPFGGVRMSYMDRHDGLQPEDVELVPARLKYFQDVASAMFGRFGNVMGHGADESGWTALRGQAVVIDGLAQMSPSTIPLQAGSTRPIVCRFADIGLPTCDGSGAPLGALGNFNWVPPTSIAPLKTAPLPPPPSDAEAKRAAAQAQAKTWCSDLGLKLQLWQCNANEGPLPNPSFLAWFHDATAHMAAKWTAIAARDSAVLRYQLESDAKNKQLGQQLLVEIQAAAQKQYVSEGQKQLALVQAQATALAKVVKATAAQTAAIKGPAKGLTAQQKQAIAIGAGGIGIAAAIAILL